MKNDRRVSSKAPAASTWMIHAMTTCDSRMALYEQRIKGLEHRLKGMTQVWHLSEDLYLPHLAGNRPSWPIDYALVAVVPTDDITAAIPMANDDQLLLDETVQLLEPFGWDPIPGTSQAMFRFPRGTSVGDVLVTPNEVAYIVQDIGFRRIADL